MGNYVMEVFVDLIYEDYIRVPSFMKVPSSSQKWEVLVTLFQQCKTTTAVRHVDTAVDNDYITCVTYGIGMLHQYW